LTSDEVQAKYDEDYEKAFNGEDVDDTPQETVEEEESETVEVSESEANEETSIQDTENVESVEEEQPEEDSTETLETDPYAADDKGLFTLVHNGKTVKVTAEEKQMLAQQMVDYTYKMQKLGDDKKVHQADLNMLAKIRNGDKEALAQLSGVAGIDPLDLIDIEVNSEQGTDKPAEPFMSPQVSELMQEVAKDTELFEKMQQIEDVLPAGVINVMARDPQAFYSVVNEVRSGDAEIVLPKVATSMATLSELDRSMVMNSPEQFANFYMNVKQSMINEAKPPQAETKPTPKEKVELNPAEIAVKKSGQGRGQEVTQDAYLSEEKYKEILERLAQG